MGAVESDKDGVLQSGDGRYAVDAVAVRRDEVDWMTGTSNCQIVPLENIFQARECCMMGSQGMKNVARPTMILRAA